MFLNIQMGLHMEITDLQFRENFLRFILSCVAIKEDFYHALLILLIIHGQIEAILRYYSLIHLHNF